MTRQKIKRLNRKIPGERILVPSNDPDYEWEEVRTCYDTADFLPKYDDNPDDEDLSDCWEDNRRRGDYDKQNGLHRN